MTALETLVLAAATLGAASSAGQALALRAALARRSPAGADLPPVSILKPQRGVDDCLRDNLESFCRLDYPRYEVVLAVRDPHDPALRVARKVRERHPGLWRGNRLAVGPDGLLAPYGGDAASPLPGAGFPLPEPEGLAA